MLTGEVELRLKRMCSGPVTRMCAIGPLKVESEQHVIGLIGIHIELYQQISWNEQ